MTSLWKVSINEIWQQNNFSSFSMCTEQYKELKQKGKKKKWCFNISQVRFFRISVYTTFPHVTFGSIGAYLACQNISFHISSILNGLEMYIRPSSNHSQFDGLMTSLSRQLEVSSCNASFLSFIPVYSRDCSPVGTEQRASRSLGYYAAWFCSCWLEKATKALVTGLPCQVKGIILIYTSCGSDQYFGQVDVCICYFGKQILVSFRDCFAQAFNINDENMIHTVALLGAESQPRRRQ